MKGLNSIHYLSVLFWFTFALDFSGYHTFFVLPFAELFLLADICPLKMIRQFYNKTSPKLQLQTQQDLLAYFCRTPFVSQRLSLPSGAINYIEMKRHTGVPVSTLVLTHGFGSGLGFFYPNLDKLAARYDRVIAVDWLGMGSSSRDVTGKQEKRACGDVCDSLSMTPTVATDFFIDSLEELRKAINISSFVLAGHSLGGYLAGRYALKYPKELRGLALISPVGIPSHPPDAVNTDDLSLGFRVINSAWKHNFTPQSLVRMRGSAKGQEVVRNILKRRFNNQDFQEEHLSVLSKYLYQITAAPACGEYCLNSILLPIVSGTPQNGSKRTNASVYAREPLEELFQKQQLDIPSALVMYGDTDWLMYPGITQSMKSWKQPLHSSSISW